MDQEPNARFVQFGRRDLSRIPPDEILLAARYWAANTVIMSLMDPWRSHLFALNFAALIAPTAEDLAAWLLRAHKAVRGTSLQTSPYEQARLELLSSTPPWLEASERAIPGLPGLGTHNQRWSKELRLVEMGRLLDEVAADGQLAVAPNGVITL